MPFLLAGLDESATSPWDSGEFDEPGDVTDRDRVNVTDVLAAGWDARTPDDDHEADPESASAQTAPFTCFPGTPRPARQPPLRADPAGTRRPAGRPHWPDPCRPAEALPLLAWTASDQYSDLTPLAAVLQSWEDATAPDSSKSATPRSGCSSAARQLTRTQPASS